MTETSSRRNKIRGYTEGEKEAVRLWYEFLRVALSSNTPEVVDALKHSQEFYAPWEMDRFTSFNEFWASQKNLFVDSAIVRRLSDGEQPPSQSLVLVVPLNKGVTELLTDIKSVLLDEFERFGHHHGQARRKRQAMYLLTPGSQPKLEAIREMLSCYRDVYLRNPHLKGKKLLKAVHSYYLGRKNKKWAKIPEVLKFKSGDEDDKIRIMRNIRRYLQMADQIVLNVAKGDFPGDYR